MGLPEFISKTIFGKGMATETVEIEVNDEELEKLKELKGFFGPDEFQSIEIPIKEGYVGGFRLPCVESSDAHTRRFIIFKKKE